MVYALCRLILRDTTEAEDAAQQTFLSAYRSLLNGTAPEQPEAWLATIARNECRHRISRRPPSTVELLDTDGDGDGDLSGVLDSRAEIEALCAAVAELPTKQREAIVLREFYGLSYREVAAALGTTGTAVESAIFKSRRSLQERLRPMRDAAGSLALPLSLQDSLAQLIPGFSQAAAGGGGVAMVAKLSVPFGVKALVTGLSVVAVGGTIAAEHPRKHGLPMVMPAPSHALVQPNTPAPAAVPQMHYTPRVHVSAAPKAIQISNVTTKPAAHESDSSASVDDHSTNDSQPAEKQRNNDHGSGSHSSEHNSDTSPAVHDSTASDDQKQQADDARDAAEHAADAAHDAADKARDAQQTD
jgi:RNA polymerase sigma-70 factor (ECF subfamily)